MTALRRLTDWWLDRPSLDYPLVALAVATALAYDPSNVLGSELHGVWYQTLAGVSGVLLTIGGVAITLVFTVTPGDRLAAMYARLGPNVERLVMSCLGGLVITTAGFAGMLLLESRGHPLRVAASAALMSFGVLRFGRLWWMLRRILQALIARYAEPPVSTEASWKAPEVSETDYAIGRRRPQRKGNAR
jgi:hypothetical protein